MMKGSWFKMDDISGNILSLLGDTSFPPLVMLDGDWGEGKTYYTQKTLIPALEKLDKKCVFFSLTGLSSIDDFKDRLLSASILKNEINGEETKAIAGVFGTLLKSFGGEASGTIASLLGGASGLIKESLLTRISDRYIIIDDLDRVKKKDLSDLIIGECLQLADSGNLRFIFVVNDKKSLADNAMKEKVFSGVIKLDRSVSEAVNIAFSNYDWFDSFKDEIVKVVSDKSLKNLRVLKRCSKKINSIYLLIELDGGFDFNASISQVINSVITVMYFHYEKGLDETNIWEKSELYNSLSDGKDEEYKKYSELFHIRSLLTKEFISYCVGGSNWKIKINDIGRLPKKSCPIDAFLFAANFQLDDTQFEDNVDILSKFVFDDINVEFSKWFEAAYYYYFLQINNFLSSDRPSLREDFDTLVDKKVFDYTDFDGRTHRLRIDSEVTFIFEKYVAEQDKHRGNQKQTKQSDIFVRMKASWGNVNLEVYKTHQYEPFFNQFKINQLKDCVNCWSNKDILYFNDFISERYKSSNIKNYLSDELDIIEKLLGYVDELHEDEPLGRRKGSLGFLSFNLKTAVKSLQTDLK
ncbi:MAG: hypothetical protein ACJAS9_003732 [Polaribacter sp.]|jgi:hypothetical protein